MTNFAELNYNDKTYKYPVITGAEQEQGMDISNLLSETGLVTLDVGFKNTGSTQSNITFIDGDQGKLYYRGYPIEQLAEHSSFMEVSYLLINGELPTADQLQAFEKEISMHTLVHENVKKFLDAYPSDSHPMGVLMSVTTALSSFYPGSLNPNKTPEEVSRTIMRLLAKMPTIAAWTYKKSLGHPFMYPDNRLGYMNNFVSMMFGMRSEPYHADPVVVDALDKLFILHADHEQNCSTATVRMVGSAHTNLYATIGAGIAALWGPRHGGANQSVIEMLEEIKADGGNVQKYVDMVKDKNSHARLMGFGHRVYKNFDPRAQIIKKSCDAVLNKLGVNDEILDIAKALEEVALKDDYFISRKLYPNVDFYSGIIYRAIGIPTEMFTVMFALGRLPGWIAQWKEMRTNNEPIGRPRQIYTGTPLRDYVPITKRT
jgi:citrate synthase